MTVGTYGIFDSKTDECLYVGLSSDMDGRWRRHIINLLNGNHLRKDFVHWFEMKNRDIDSMIFKVLEECENDDSVLNLLELKWFEILEPRFAGKIPNENEKWKHSDETKAKIRKAAFASAVKRGLNDRRIKGDCIICGNESSSFRSHFCSNSCQMLNRRKKAFNGQLPDISDIIERYESGETSNSIGKSYGVSYMTILRLMESENVKIRPRGTARR